MIHELAEPVESATHVRVEQIQESWSRRRGTIHLRVSFGEMVEVETDDGIELRFQENPRPCILHTHRCRISGSDPPLQVLPATTSSNRLKTQSGQRSSWYGTG